MATPTSSHSRNRTYSRFQPASNLASAEDHQGLHPTVSASVGHDHWANDVLKAVDKAKSSTSGSTASGSNSPESYCDGTSDGGQPRNIVTVGASNDLTVSVKTKVLEKKRKFHTGRCLELKNLPDGCNPVY